jgi:hypothetical protein
MTVVLPMYVRIGVEPVRDAPAIHGVSCAICLKRLSALHCAATIAPTEHAT